MHRQTQKVTAATAEIGNVTVNCCYDGANVTQFLEEGGVAPLIILLRSRDTAVQASILGALQGVCYVSWGRHAIMSDPSTIMIIGRFLLADDEFVRTRAIGVIHNLSADISAIPIIRDSMCISPIISLLSDPLSEVVQAAAGALQNISREDSSRIFMLDQGAVPKLLNILFGSNTQSQICAVGALLNLLGPQLGDRETAALCQLLSDGIVLGSMQSAIFGDEDN